MLWYCHMASAEFIDDNNYDDIDTVFIQILEKYGKSWNLM